jgi:predicted TIM-barrel fold metal-dependent hydrolase
MKIIDFHTHAFPDSLAEVAMPRLEGEGNVKACLDGKLSSLLGSMDRAEISKSVVSSIATKPSQFQSILEWSLSIASDRIIPFPSIHPNDPAALERIDTIASEGFKGIKMHPYYQDFVLDDEDLYSVYERMSERGLILLAHTGFDIAFERKRIADPKRILRIAERFPKLKLVTSHFGGWEDWRQVEKVMVGRPIYMDISYSFEYMDHDIARRILTTHPQEFLLFGTDSPWGDQQRTLDLLRGMGLGSQRLSAILSSNAEGLLKLS